MCVKTAIKIIVRLTRLKNLSLNSSSYGPLCLQRSIVTVDTCLKDLEMSGKLAAVSEI